MADIELVIKIPKRVYNYIRKYEHIANSDVLDIKDAIINGTPLPKGQFLIITERATNGDVIKGAFPRGIKIDRSTAYAKRVTEDWLNAPYKAEKEEI